MINWLDPVLSKADVEFKASDGLLTDTLLSVIHASVKTTLSSYDLLPQYQKTDVFKSYILSSGASRVAHSLCQVMQKVCDAMGRRVLLGDVHDKCHEPLKDLVIFVITKTQKESFATKPAIRHGIPRMHSVARTVCNLCDK